MIHAATKCARAAAATIRGRAIPVRYTTPLRLIHGVPNANHVAIQMVNYALSHASYDQVSQDSKATVLLAMSDLLYESSEAIERLKQVMSLTLSSFAIRVVAVEALVGLLIQSGQDDASLNVADEILELVKERGHENLQDVAATAKTIKGLTELVKGSIESGRESISTFLFFYVIRHSVLVLLFIRNFGDAEETLTSALTSAEEHYGHNHPKVGVILTGVALMYWNKAKQERSSSIMIQEGLFRRALELMKAPPLDSEGIINVETQEVMALARGGED
ncbi:hypothetical protein F2Q69_00000081 [Brassica cretica]|uniref:Uncharacterized protein n=1 Tax=Brassica cretica TaxID=69181 RepID=A0A8S9PKY1_BRACR|nr:hypothetical protein F2Q69_00000081 [Brassica cretica]